MREPVLDDGILKRLRDMGLAHQIVECLWPVFARENFVTHTLNLMEKVDGW